MAREAGESFHIEVAPTVGKGLDMLISVVRNPGYPKVTRSARTWRAKNLLGASLASAAAFLFVFFSVCGQRLLSSCRDSRLAEAVSLVVSHLAAAQGPIASCAGQQSCVAAEFIFEMTPKLRRPESIVAGVVPFVSSKPMPKEAEPTDPCRLSSMSACRHCLPALPISDMLCPVARSAMFRNTMGDACPFLPTPEGF